MKSVRSAVWLVFLALSTVAFAQSDGQKSFDKMKTLAGDWDGAVTVTPPMPEMGNGDKVHVSLRITSRGNAIVHEMQAPERRWMRRSTTIQSPCFISTRTI